MGNTYSDLKNPFSTKQIPKHLKPMKKKKKKLQPQQQFGEAIDTPLAKKDHCIRDGDGNKIILNPIVKPAIEQKIMDVKEFDNLDDNELAQEETMLVGSGPRSAFRWFKGRRYLNYATQRGLDNTLLPNDQLELDRMRVLAFIIRWAFKGDVVAPVEHKLIEGINVLNVGYGPGMWTGHHIIDMAMDYGNSNFTAVDVMDLLPPDFEETAITNSNNNKEKTVLSSEVKKHEQLITPSFTPMHPNLSLKLQNTTTPVTESSTLDSSSGTYSNIMLSQIDESSTISKDEAVSYNSLNSSTTHNSNTIEQQQQQQSHINSEESPDVTPDIKHRKLLPNLDFYQVNVIDVKLPFEDNHFDFVMQRLVTASFTVSDWKNVIAELVRVTKPGGMIQLLEIDYNTFNLGPNGRKWESTLIETARLKRHMEPRIARNLSDVLKATGLIDVGSKLVSIPLGSWGLDLGNLWKHNMEMFVDSTCPLLSKLAGVTEKEYRNQWYGMFKEVHGQKPFTNIHAAYGRKPFNTTTTIDWSLCPPLPQ